MWFKLNAGHAGNASCVFFLHLFLFLSRGKICLFLRSNATSGFFFTQKFHQVHIFSTILVSFQEPKNAYFNQRSRFSEERSQLAFFAFIFVSRFLRDSDAFSSMPCLMTRLRFFCCLLSIFRCSGGPFSDPGWTTTYAFAILVGWQDYESWAKAF